ncbi:putative transporter small subunit [Luteimonas sp. YGD11-2]|nr:putative transporter small subunit [Luteimonas sp. YGD11-2]
MNVYLMTLYVLLWPLLVAIMMVVIGRGVLMDIRRARRTGEDLV